MRREVRGDIAYLEPPAYVSGHPAGSKCLSVRKVSHFLVCLQGSLLLASPLESCMPGRTRGRRRPSPKGRSGSSQRAVSSSSPRHTTQRRLVGSGQDPEPNTNLGKQRLGDHDRERERDACPVGQGGWAAELNSAQTRCCFSLCTALAKNWVRCKSPSAALNAEDGQKPR